MGMRTIDVFLVGLAVVIVCWTQYPNSSSEIGPIAVGGSCAGAVIIYCLDLGGAYRIERRPMPTSQARVLLGALAAGTAVFALCLGLLRTLRADEIGLGIWVCLTLVSLAGARGVWARLLRAWRARGTLEQRVAVVGINELSRAFTQQVAANPGCNLRIVGVYTDDEDASDDLADTQRSGTVEDLSVRSRRERIDAIVLAVPLSETARVDRLRHRLRSVTAEIYATPDIIKSGIGIDRVCALGTSPVVRVCRRPMTEWQRFQKTVFDRLLGAVLLIALLPALILIAAAIRLESPGPVLFRQPRIGFNNRNFTIYKFRTMFHSADRGSLTGARQARRNDPRITRIGKWLRKLSLDELPQLLNVMKGEMSLVGPRPHPPETRAADRLFQDVVEDYAMRHRVRPGITGWAQVSGWRGETVTIRQIEQRVAHDLYYIDNWSLLFDIRIMFLTLINEIRSKTAF